MGSTAVFKMDRPVEHRELSSRLCGSLDGREVWRRMDTLRGFPGGASGKEPTCQCRRCKRPEFHLWVGKIPWSRKWQPASVSLPGKFHRQRSLVGCIPRGCRESDTAAPTHTHKVPAGPVAKTPHSQGRGLEFHPWSGN